MKHVFIVALVIYALGVGGMLGALFLAFPTPPGTPCPQPQGADIFAYLQEARGPVTGITEGLLYLSGTDANDTQGVVATGCTAYQDTLTLYLSGQYANYSVNVTQHTISGNSSAWLWTYKTLPVNGTPEYWDVVAVRMPSAPQIEAVTIAVTEKGNLTGVAWQFFHLTPNAALVNVQTTAGQWEFGLSLFLAGLFVAWLAFRLSLWTIRRMGYRSQNLRKASGVLFATDGIFILGIYSDWLGVQWHLGGLSSYALILLPTFINVWILSIPRGETKRAIAEMYLPDVLGEFSSRRKSHRQQDLRSAGKP